MESWVEISLLLEEGANLIQVFLVLDEVLLENFVVGFCLRTHVKIDYSQSQKEREISTTFHELIDQISLLIIEQKFIDDISKHFGIGLKHLLEDELDRLS